jgi:hypothetical protein
VNVDERLVLTASQIQSQQSNIGLMSALLLTLQFSFMYGFPGSWDDLVTKSYFAGSMNDDQLDSLHEVNCSLSSPSWLHQEEFFDSHDPFFRSSLLYVLLALS